MHAHGLKDNNDLQAYFNQRVQKIVAKHGKTMLGWDEILRPDLPKTIVIQSWRGPIRWRRRRSRAIAGLLSSGYYVDLMWPAERHYATEPLTGAAANLTPEEQKRILGGEACMWAEYVSPENIDSRIWPRTAAIAERLWSPQDVRDVNSMYQRLAEVSHGLDGLGLDPQLQLRSHASPHRGDRRHLRPQSAGRRARAGQGLHARGNCARARHQRLAAESRGGCGASGKRDRAAVCRCRERAGRGNIQAGDGSPGQRCSTSWRDNQVELQPQFEKSLLLKEVAPVSQNLSALGAAGLAALDYLDRGEAAPPAGSPNNSRWSSRPKSHKLNC